MLARPHLAARLAAQHSTVEQQPVALYERLAIQVSPLATPNIIAPDPADDYVLACAMAAHADLVVSGDKRQLLNLARHQGIDIVTAREAVQRITTAQ